MKKPMCTCIWAFLSIKKKFILLNFLSILVGLERKHMSHTIYFSSFLPNQTHSKKVLLSIFSLKFSIHTISPNKYTLCAWGGVNSTTIIGGLEEKIFGFHHLLSFFPIQPNTLQKSFLFHFLSKVFYPPCLTSKQTHPQ